MMYGTKLHGTGGICSISKQLGCTYNITSAVLYWFAVNPRSLFNPYTAAFAIFTLAGEFHLV
jgi:hypothetical protein